MMISQKQAYNSLTSSFQIEDGNPYLEDESLERALKKQENLSAISDKICELVKSKASSQSQKQNQQQDPQGLWESQGSVHPQNFQFEQQQENRQSFEYEEQIDECNGYEEEQYHERPLHQVKKQQDQNSLNDQQKNYLKNILTIAQLVKQSLPQYSIESSICKLSNDLIVLKSHLDLSQQNRTQKSRPNYVNQDNWQESSSAINQSNVSPRLRKEPQISIPDEIQPENEQDIRQAKKVVKVRHQAMQVRQKREIEVARIYIKFGYGLHIARSVLRYQITPNTYNSLMTSIIRSSIRRACDILTKVMKKDVKPFDHFEEKLLRSPMANCKKWLPPKELNAFYKIIEVVYCLKDSTIYEDEVMGLYQKMRKQLQKRSDDNQNQSVASSKHSKSLVASKSEVKAKLAASRYSNISQMTPNGNSTVGVKVQPSTMAQHNNTSLAGNPAIEKQIAELYVSFKNQKSVHLVISKKYSQNNWSVQEIKATIDRLIKIGIKKIMKFWKYYSTKNKKYPTLVLNEKIVNRILSHPIAQPVRISMVQCLMEKVLSAERTFQLVNFINQCMKQINLQ